VLRKLSGPEKDPVEFWEVIKLASFRTKS
jgi:hypothetical protein